MGNKAKRQARAKKKKKQGNKRRNPTGIAPSRNCHTCRLNRSKDGETPGLHPYWCQPFLDEMTGEKDRGVIKWTERVGLDELNMPPKQTVACPCHR